MQFNQRKDDKSMKKFLTALLCGAMLAAMACIGVSADNIQNDKVICYKISSLTGKSDPYTTGTDDDSKVSYFTYGSGSIAMKDKNIVYTPKGATSMFEAVFFDNKWCVPVQEYSFLKIRYKTNKAVTDSTSTTYWLSGNQASFKFDLKATGKWEETIIDLNAMGVNWSSYVDDGKWDKSACRNEPKMRSFRFDFPKIDGIEYEIDYIAYLSTKEAAEKFDGTLESLTVKKADTSAPATADMAGIAILAGASAAAAIVICKKSKKR